jgi:hypothetical protein
MRRHQPFIYLVVGAILGGLGVFQVTTRPSFTSLDTKTWTRAERTELENDAVPGHENEHEGSQERLFGFQHEHGKFLDT